MIPTPARRRSGNPIRVPCRSVDRVKRAVAIAVAAARLRRPSRQRPAARPARARAPSLFGTVGPGFEISLRDAQGNAVTKVDPGTYEIEVTDLATDAHVPPPGAGVDERTEVEFTGTVTWTVTFQDGSYSFFCDVHPTQMRGTFVSGNAPACRAPPSNVVTPKTRSRRSRPGPAQRDHAQDRSRQGREEHAARDVQDDRPRPRQRSTTPTSSRLASTSGPRSPSAGRQRGRSRSAGRDAALPLRPALTAGMRGSARIVP